MRVTATMLANSLIQNLDNAQSRLQTLQEEAATGQKFQYPSDNPEAVTTTMDLNQSLANIRNYLSNITAAQNFLNTTAGALQQMTQNLNRASALGIQAQSGTMNATDRAAVVEQLNQLVTEMGNILNTRFEGVYIFAGASAQSQVVSGSPAQDVNLPPAGGTPLTEQLAVGQNSTVTENINGYEIQAGTSVLAQALNAVEGLAAAVAGNNPATLSSAIQAVQNAAGAITQESTIVGARLERLSAQQSRLNTLATALHQSVATVSGADLAQVTTNLALEEEALKAALQSGAQVLPLSLLNFIQP